jgi:hypothetical protein
MELRIDQVAVGKVSVPATSWTSYTIDANVTSGTHNVAIAFTNDYKSSTEDRNLYVDKVTITNGPQPDRSLIVGPRVGEVLQGRLTPIIASTTLANVSTLELRIDGKTVATSTTTSIRYGWNPKDAGTHTIEVYALNGTSVLAYWSQTVPVK